MKITRADFRHEASIFQQLSAGASHHGRKHVLQLLDNFQIDGPNGTHEALVTDILVPIQYLRDLRIFDPKRTSYDSRVYTRPSLLKPVRNNPWWYVSFPPFPR